MKCAVTQGCIEKSVYRIPFQKDLISLHQAKSFHSIMISWSSHAAILLTLILINQFSQHFLYSSLCNQTSGNRLETFLLNAKGKVSPTFLVSDRVTFKGDNYASAIVVPYFIQKKNLLSENYFLCRTLLWNGTQKTKNPNSVSKIYLP